MATPEIPPVQIVTILEAMKMLGLPLTGVIKLANADKLSGFIRPEDGVMCYIKDEVEDLIADINRSLDRV